MPDPDGGSRAAGGIEPGEDVKSGPATPHPGNPQYEQGHAGARRGGGRRRLAATARVRGTGGRQTPRHAGGWPLAVIDRAGRVALAAGRRRADGVAGAAWTSA